MNNFYDNIGNLIKHKRLSKGMSTQELAAKLDISVGLLNNLENAKSDTFNISLMDNLCKELEISPLNFLPDLNSSELLTKSLLDDSVRNEDCTIGIELKTNIEKIISLYINCIKAYEYNTDIANKITSKILQDLSFINDLKHC